MTESEIRNTIKDAVKDAYDSEKRRGGMTKGKKRSWLWTTIKWALALFGFDWIMGTDVFESILDWFDNLFL